MSRRFRASVVTLLLLCTTVAAFAIWANLQWRSIKQQWSLSSVSWQGLSWDQRSQSWALEHLSVLRKLPDGSEQQLALQNISLNSGGLWPWPVHKLSIEHSQLTLLPSTTPSSTEYLSLPSPQIIEQIHSALPHSLNVKQFTLSLPCQQSRCEEQWSLTTETLEDRLMTRWQASRQDVLHPLHLSGTLNTSNATLSVQLDKKTLATAQLQWDPRERHQNVQGDLHLQVPPQRWLSAQLNRWVDLPALWHEPWPQDAQINARWDIQWPEQLPAEDYWTAVKGQLDVQLIVSSPYSVPNIGTVTGELQVQLINTEKAWRLLVDNSEITWQPEAALLPVELKQLVAPSYRITLTPSEVDSVDGIAAQVLVRSQGSSALDQYASATLNLHRFPAPELTVKQGQLRLHSQHLRWQDTHAKQVSLTASFNAAINNHKAHWQWQPDSKIQAKSLTESSAGVTAHNPSLTTHGQINWDTQNGLHFSPAWPLTARVTSLDYPAVRPMQWDWQGTLTLGDNWTLQGSLKNAAQLHVDALLTQTPKLTQLKLKLPSTSILKANPISQTLAVWPSAFLMVQGAVQAEADLSWHANQALQLHSTIHLRDLGGVYGRTELLGLNAQINAQIKNNWLTLSSPELSLQQANVGLAATDLSIKKLSLAGPYQQINQGDIRWGQVSFALFDGQVSSGMGMFSLAKQSLDQPIAIQGINLAHLLEEYPASGLSGTGIIDGRLQLRYNPSGFRIDNGQLQARPEGGVLNFDSSKIYAAARTNPALQIVVSALENFHYQRLSSSIRYDENGTLMLGMTLQGQNPELESGHPIHFSINLEENIPALLTSLQLSDRVSETLQERVKERLQRNHSPEQ